ncbi:6513_t:CDS:2 [Cetraspora pellucida]|uniref:6513_t:CDS:1 n=1 Tax=Cetraspora pellucida TaxID=1433469 RepID=A0A9N8Z5Z9_9GLOM|nr:6513_t:CDS:2 [Cetraspora pellucida]
MGQSNSYNYDAEEDVTEVSPSQARRLDANTYRKPTLDYAKKNVLTENTQNTKPSWEKEMAASLPEISGSNHFQSSRFSSVKSGDFPSLPQQKLPQQKKVTTSIRHEEFPALPHTLKTTVVEKKENTNSFNKPFTKTIQSKKMTSLASGTVLLTESKKTTSFIYRELEYIQGRYKNKREQIIFYIIQNLCMYNDYKVCGYWECSECRGSLKPYSQESLENFLKMAPGQLYNSFVEFCRSDNCNRKHFITSFRMYSYLQPINLNEIPINEVILHLQWDKYYRVFGEWECTNCKNSWKSAYTWISLQKFIQQDLDLNSDDYCMQNCKRCKSDKSVIKLYKPLDKGESNKHKRHLCAKCISGDYCCETGDYLGKKYEQ